MSREQPPGWYPDPAGQRILFWWDGQKWTGDTRPPAGEGGPLSGPPRQPSFTSALQQPAYPGPPRHYQQPDPSWPPYSHQQPYEQSPWPPQGPYQPSPGRTPETWPRQPQARRNTPRGLVYAGIAALVLISGVGTYALAGHWTSGVSLAKPLTCNQQYDAWKTGPADTPDKQLDADLSQISTAGNDEDITAQTSALKTAGADAAVLERYPMPACADPGGYWMQTLAHIKAAGDNAGRPSSHAGLVLAEAPLKEVPGLEQKLTAELKRAAVTGSG
jgi:hypothetical protein